MSGETDLGRILSVLDVRQREGVFVYVTIPPGDALPDVPIAAMISEVEGITVIVSRDHADDAGLDWDYESAWLTLTVHTSLEAVGLSASLTTAMAMRGIPCNLLAGYHHDHMLVPLDRVGDATEAVELIRAQGDAAIG